MLLTCLESEPDDRFGGAGQLARQLELCLQPQVQDLLRPGPRSWRRWVVRWPVAALVLVALAANAPLSVLNSMYNLQEVLEATRVFEHQQQLFKNVQLVVVNVAAYVLGIAMSYWLMHPVIVGLRKVRAGETLEPEPWARSGGRCLNLGHDFALISLALWLTTSIVFPAWMDLSVRESSIDAWSYLHFFTSQALCGLIAAALTFFAVTFLSVRAIYPRLLPPHALESGAGDDLNTVSLRMRKYSLVLGLVFFVAIMAVIGIGMERGAAPRPADSVGRAAPRSDDSGAVSGEDIKAGALADAADTIEKVRRERLVFGVLAVLGLLSFGVAFQLSKLIQTDLDALQVAVNPAGVASVRSDDRMSTSSRGA